MNAKSIFTKAIINYKDIFSYGKTLGRFFIMKYFFVLKKKKIHIYIIVI